MSFQNNAINHGVNDSPVQSQSTIAVPASYDLNSLEVSTTEISSEISGK